MRLTLRTLLAYLDDVLEPQHAKEIGAKIAESNYASALINRIREVTRRRRLTAPDVSGPKSGLDPNTVAEYLDNTLPPDNVADVERVCLESDMHLAEVAASHQILTLVLGEPVEVPQSTREQMYVLGPLRQPVPPPAPEPVSAPLPNTLAPGAKPAAATNGTFATSIPEYLRPKPLWKRLLPYTLVGLLLAVWLGVLMSDPSLFRGADQQTAEETVLPPDQETQQKIAQNENPQPGQKANVLPNNQEPLPPNVQIDPEPPADDPSNTGPSIVQNNPPVTLPLPENPVVTPDPQTTPLEPTPKNPPEVAVVTPENPNLPRNLPENPPANTPTTPPATPPMPVEQQPQPFELPRMEYTSAEGILLQFDPTSNGWFVMPKRSVLKRGERFAAVYPFVADFRIGEGTLQMALFGNSLMRVLSPSELIVKDETGKDNQAADFGFELWRGQMILEGSLEALADEQAELKSVPVGVQVRGELWRVELLTPDTRCGLEIIPRKPDKVGQVFDQDRYTGTLYVTSGSVRFADGLGKVQVVSANQYIPLTPSARQLAAAQPIPTPAPTFSRQPEWLDPANKPVSRSLQQYSVKFEKEFEIGKPVSYSIPPLVTGRPPLLTELAVKCLVITQHYQALVKALLQADYPEARMAAFQGLREWLPLAPEHDALLLQELNKLLPGEDVPIVHRLLWGYSEGDARNKFTSEQLVSWLDHPKPAVREMAIYHIESLTGRDYRYSPNQTEQQRRTAVNRWKEHLEKEGALISQ